MSSTPTAVVFKGAPEQAHGRTTTPFFVLIEGYPVDLADPRLEQLRRACDQSGRLTMKETSDGLFIEVRAKPAGEEETQMEAKCLLFELMRCLGIQPEYC